MSLGGFPLTSTDSYILVNILAIRAKAKYCSILKIDKSSHLTFLGRAPLASGFRYDELGFPTHFHSFFEGEESFDHTLSTIDKQSQEMLVKAQSIEDNLSLSLQWEKLLSNVGVGCTVQRSKELKHLLRKGVPNNHRPLVWKW